jgi:hypothetical protein
MTELAHRHINAGSQYYQETGNEEQDARLIALFNPCRLGQAP